MSVKLAIIGSKTNSKEIEKLFISLGGCKSGYDTFTEDYYYYIDDYNNITGTTELSKCFKWKVFTYNEFVTKYPFKVGDKVMDRYGNMLTIKSMEWSEDCETMVYDFKNAVLVLTAEDLLKYNDNPNKHSKEEENMKDNKLFGTVSNPVETKSYTVNLKDDKVIDNSIDTSQFMQIGKILAVCFNTENYENEVELQLGNYEIKVRDGKTYAVFKKPKYPKTYEECCKNYPDNEKLKIGNLLCDLEQLIICRNAYWKVAGEEMGLRKSWEPDWCDEEQDKYCISYGNGNIEKGTWRIYNSILAFPTKEMRDAFYDNLRILIENCKELL